MMNFRHVTAVAVAVSGVIVGSSGTAATITGWNTDNVEVALNPADGDTGLSVVYDRALPDTDAVTNGRIAFTPPEAQSPGIKVQVEEYDQSGGTASDLTFAGCLMTSNPGATCISPFQSGKRIKQQMTGTGPVDLVFDVDNDDTDSTYQVFHRLINDTNALLDGFKIELGYGIGDGFEKAGDDGALSFSSLFAAQPQGSGSASTQFPFGLFGDADTNPNFTLDGFFANARTGFSTDFSAVEIASDGIFGPYTDFFDTWLPGQSVPAGVFWDNDNDPGTDALVMAWQRPDGSWEIRREIASLADGTAAALAAPVELASFDAVVDWFEGREGGTDLTAVLLPGEIEDLANLNVNFAIQLAGNLFDAAGDALDSFTLRTTVFAAPIAAIPLPAGAPLLLGGLGMLWALRRRRQQAV
jgi:hypothetical protein